MMEKLEKSGVLHAAVGYAIVLAVILGLVLFYYSSLNPFARYQDKYPRFQSTVQAIREHRLDDAVASFRAIIPFASNKAAEAYTRIQLATTLVARDSSGDREEAVSILTAVARDPATPVSHQAAALYTLAWLVNITYETPGMSERYIATLSSVGDPFKTFVEAASGALPLVVRKLYEESDRRAPNAYAKLGAALTYEPELYERARGQSGTAESVAATMEKYYADALPSTTWAVRYSHQEFNQMFLARGHILMAIDLVRHDIPPEDIESAFASALTEADRAVSSPGFSALARIEYAVFLNQRYGTEKTSEVQALLKPLGSIGAIAPIFKEWIQNIAVRSQGDFLKDGIENLVMLNISPELNAFLPTVGWKVMQ